MSRRHSRRGGRGAGGPPLKFAQIHGVVGTNSVANRYETAAGAGIVGVNATGVWAAVLFEVTSQAVSALNRSPAAAYPAWNFRVTPTNNSVRFESADLSVSSPIATIAAGDVGKIQLVVGSFDVAGGFLRIWYKAAQIGAGTAIAAYTDASAIPTTMASVPAGNNSEGMNVYALWGGDGPLTHVEALQLFADVKQTLAPVAVPGKTTHLWDIGASSPATVPDQIGGGDMTKAGALTGITRTISRFQLGW